MVSLLGNIINSCEEHTFIVTQRQDCVVAADFYVTNRELTEWNAIKDSVGGVLIREQVFTPESTLLMLLFYKSLQNKP